MLTAERVRHGRTHLVEQAARADTVTDVFAQAARRLDDLLGYDAAAWMTADPATGLPSAPSLLENCWAPRPTSTEQWRREYVDTDTARFRDLARAARPAAAVRPTATDPWSGARFRWFTQPLAFADELRAVFRVDGTPWALLTLWRRAERPSFTRAEAELMASLSEPLGEAVRRVVRTGPAVRTSAAELPGLLTFDPDGRLVAVDDHAARWLEELPCQELVPTRFGLSIPVWLLVTAARSNTSLLSGGDGAACTRVQSRRGRWLVGRASSTRDADGAPAETVVVIEPAGPALMAPVLADAYGLTDREKEVARLIARGCGTAEIADSLYLSGHTIRDHVKSLLRKVQVCTRGELVAALYTEQAGLAPPTRLGSL